MSHQFFFSPYILDNLVPPRAGFDVVQDSAFPGLRMYVTSRGAKTFFTRKRVNGRDTRIIIGQYPKMEIEAARERVAGAIADAKTPPKIRRKKITFGKMVLVFIAKRVHRTPASTAKLIRTAARHWAPLYDIDIDKITPEMVSKIGNDIATQSGAPTANRMREVMNGVFKFAQATGYIAENPAAELVPFKESRRKSVLNAAGLRRLVDAMQAEADPGLRAAFLMLVYGFANRARVFSMQWRDLDFNNDTWGDRPLSDAAVVLLRDLPQQKQYVFLGRGGRHHLTDPRAAWHRILARAKLADIQINDVHKFMMKRLEWAGNRETLRRNMNAALDAVGVQ
ncbi:MAG: integrase family protein [Proteobacteria bacterium]|nr:integrase family protein [Pseudomonadota bacterium]